MLWPTVTPQPRTLRGQVAMPFAGRFINLTDSEEPYRGWRE